MYVTNRDFNIARKESYNALVDTLNECTSREDVTERDFANQWVGRMRRVKGVIGEGWYAPPPKGIAVLSGGIDESSRVNYDSLRNEHNWPSDNIIDFNHDLFYFYCSPVGVESGIPGDLSLTLYFGTNRDVISHFKDTFHATMQALRCLSKYNSSKSMYDGIVDYFTERGLVGCGVSYTDIAMTNLGHTLPAIDLDDVSKLSDKQISQISNSRQFINGLTDWRFEDGQQFTFEPQLRSTRNASLPQISYHFLVKYLDGEFIVNDDVVELMSKYGLC